MKRKWMILTAVLLAGAVLMGGIGGYYWGQRQIQETHPSLTAAGYDNGLTAALRAVEELKLNLNKAVVSAGGANQAVLLTQARDAGEDAIIALEGLPMGIGLQNEMSRYLRQMVEWCGAMAGTVLLGETVSAEDMEQLLRENGTVAALVEELREARESLTIGSFSEEEILKRQQTGESPKRLADLFGYESELEAIDYPELSYTGLLTESYLNRKAETLAGEAVSEAEIRKAAETFMKEVLDTTVTAELLGRSDGPVPVAFVQAVDDNGAVWDITVSESGSKILSAYSEGETTGDASITRDEAEEKARDFLRKAGFQEGKRVASDRQGKRMNLTYRLWDTGMLPAGADTASVWVDLVTGDIVGFDAGDYYRNRKERTGEPKLTREEALSKLSERLMPGDAELMWWRLTDGTEALCWACEGTFAGDRFTVLVDAMTGREVEIRQTMESEFGMSLQ